jgi:hypothetical protein
MSAETPETESLNETIRNLMAECDARPTASPGGQAPPTPDAFHAHLDQCERCRTRPFDLCASGAALLQKAATAPPTPPMKRGMGEGECYCTDGWLCHHHASAVPPSLAAPEPGDGDAPTCDPHTPEEWARQRAYIDECDRALLSQAGQIARLRTAACAVVESKGVMSFCTAVSPEALEALAALLRPASPETERAR